jgi:hypothetical protein
VAAGDPRGQGLPAPKGTLPRARWLGAGWPDYPWLFGTDGEYTAFAAVAAGQFDPIRAHLRAVRQVSDVVDDRSGKVVHDVVSDGSVYFGANGDPGNTDETAKFPSAVALVWRWTGDRSFLDEMYDFSVRNMRHVAGTLDADDDGWPEGLGNVERSGMGVEKLDNTVYTSAACVTWPTWPVPRGTPPPSGGPAAAPPRWRAASTGRGGTAGTPASSPTRSRTRPTRAATTTRSSSGTGSA